MGFGEWSEHEQILLRSVEHRDNLFGYGIIIDGEEALLFASEAD